MSSHDLFVEALQPFMSEALRAAHVVARWCVLVGRVVLEIVHHPQAVALGFGGAARIMQHTNVEIRGKFFCL